MTPHLPQRHNQRRYDLDTLRIAAFALLIFYHIGMFYVSWGWHVKSAHSGPAAEPLMRLLNPWRLSLLFLISGAALRFAIDKTERLSRFGRTRVRHLLLPLVFGMFVVIVPQAWLQLIESGEVTGGLIQFYPGYLSNAYSIISPTWNHLWYVAYILVYTVLLLPIARPLSRLSVRIEPVLARCFGGQLGWFWAVLILIAPHMLITQTLDARFPVTHDLIADWANHAHNSLWLISGYIIAKSAAVWDMLRRGRWALLVVSVGLAILLTANRDALSGAPIWQAAYYSAVILALLAWAQRLAARDWRGRAYLSEAIFPYYILHQTIIVAAGFWLTRQGLGVWAEVSLLLLTTLGGCVIGHEIIRRVPILRPVFGLKPNVKPNPSPQPYPGTPLPSARR